MVKGYREDSTSVSGFVNKVVGALPLVGLVARIFSDVGGVGGDIVDFAEFRRRVGNNSSVNDSRAFVDFQDRRGKVFFSFLFIGFLCLLDFYVFAFARFYCVC